MASQGLVNAISLADDGREAILRIRVSDRSKLEKHLFQRYPDREWGAFFKFGFSRTSWGLALSFVEPILPLPGDLKRQTEITEFAPQYNLRAFRLGRNEGIAIGVAHSHPAGFMTRPSKLDDDMDGYFGNELMHYTEGKPYCSIIFQRNERFGFTFSGRVFDRGEWLPVRTMFTIGDTIERETSELCQGKTDDPVTYGKESTTERLTELLGERSAKRLRKARIGIIGNSGTGTPVGNTLARAGVGAFVTVDPERISPSNHERTLSSQCDDFACEPLPYKAALMKRMMISINPKCEVTAYVGNALQSNVIDDLLGCDLVIGCTDTVHGRVLLSDLAKHYLLPSIDIAVDMEGRAGKLTSQLIQLTRYSPNTPCAFCYELINASDMAAELMTDEERAMRQLEANAAVARGAAPDPYWRSERQIHTVGYLTGTAGALAAGYAEGWLTGAFVMPHDAFQFDISQPQFGMIPVRVRGNGCTCESRMGWGDLAKQYRNVAKPKHWRSRALLLP